MRLADITYYGPAYPDRREQLESRQLRLQHRGRLAEEWDPRISPALKTKYTYEAGGQIKTITPPGTEPWTMEYGTADEEEANGRLVNVKRASLLSSPSVAQTTIAYGVPLSGSGAPYPMSGADVAKWGQKDVPQDATAIFPPDEVPGNPPSSYAHATVYYMDAEGQLANTATPSGAGTSSPSITTSETDEHGDVVRELTAQNRLRVLAAPEEKRKERWRRTGNQTPLQRRRHPDGRGMGADAPGQDHRNGRNEAKPACTRRSSTKTPKTAGTAPAPTPICRPRKRPKHSTKKASAQTSA